MGNQQQMWCCFHNRSEVSLCDWFWFVASCRQPRPAGNQHPTPVKPWNNWQNSWQICQRLWYNSWSDLIFQLPMIFKHLFQMYPFSHIKKSSCCCYQMASIKLNSFQKIVTFVCGESWKHFSCHSFQGCLANLRWGLLTRELGKPSGKTYLRTM